MQVELEIRSILRSELQLKKKVDKIYSFMDWDKKRLRTYIEQFGTGRDGIDKIIEKFWSKKIR